MNHQRFEKPAYLNVEMIRQTGEQISFEYVNRENPDQVCHEQQIDVAIFEQGRFASKTE
jgi:ABC-type enterochelin transport system substrate-binding protein